jgi:hypothetical protein
MQVSLDACDWAKITSFGSAENYVEFLLNDDIPDDEKYAFQVSIGSSRWCDSFMLYMSAYTVLQHLAEISDPVTADHLRRGIQQLIVESGHPDEFAMAEASDGCYWISISPPAVVEIKAHIDATDFDRCLDLLETNPCMEDGKLLIVPKAQLLESIDQHRQVVDLAVSKGYGLLGHVG